MTYVYTPIVAGATYPGYVNATETPEGLVRLTVRGAMKQNPGVLSHPFPGDTGAMAIPREEAEKLHEWLGEYLGKGHE